MKRKPKTRTRGFNWHKLAAGIIMIAAIIALLLFPWASQAKMEKEKCDEHLALHAIKFTVLNRYPFTIRVFWQYSWPINSERGDFFADQEMVVYSMTGFHVGDDVTVTWTVFKLVHNIPEELPDKIQKMNLASATLVHDNGYKQRLGTYTTASLECVSEYVFSGPTLVYGRTAS
jgi:hypothetical protein